MKTPKPILVIAAVFVCVQLLALGLMYFALTTSDQAFENPEDPMIAIYYLVLMLGFTLLFLVLIKFNFEKFLKAIFFASIGFVIFFVAFSIVRWIVDDIIVLYLISVIFAALAIIALWKKPEWYIIDSVGLVMSVGIIALLGISLGVIPVVILLIALAVYDAISVYKTKHMLKLADGVIDMGLPLLLVVPKKLPYSFIENKPKIQSEEKKEREAYFVGLGDIIIPGLLPASAFWFINSTLVFGIPAYLIIALASILGGVIGLLLLMRIVMKGNPQAGLPLLNTGVIAGFIISYLLIFGFNFSHLM